ncbi:MAG: OmpH family outer membrane protein [Phycisphaerales bacterium]|nr:OmpH family outer membrane protein [Phycisphaerales bacterium]
MTTRSKCIALVLAWLLLPTLAWAQSKIGVVDTARIFNEMKETQELQTKLQQDRDRLADEERQKRGHIQALREARDQLKADSPQYQQRNEELLKASVEFEVWGRMMQASVQRQQKQQIARLFDKIEQAVTEVAKTHNMDLVLAQQAMELPDDLDKINVDQLKQLINERTVLYAADNLNISAEVITYLDAKYKGN